MGSKKQKVEMSAEDACVCMHTALRKCCDSKITSAAYNLIHVLCNLNIQPKRYDPWHILGKLVAEKVNSTPPAPPAAALRNVIRSGALTDALYEEKRKDEKTFPIDATSAMWALQCTLQCFAEEDINGMAAYLKEE